MAQESCSRKRGGARDKGQMWSEWSFFPIFLLGTVEAGQTVRARKGFLKNEFVALHIKAQWVIALPWELRSEGVMD